MNEKTNRRDLLRETAALDATAPLAHLSHPLDRDALSDGRPVTEALDDRPPAVDGSVAQLLARADRSLLQQLLDDADATDDVPVIMALLAEHGYRFCQSVAGPTFWQDLDLTATPTVLTPAEAHQLLQHWRPRLRAHVLQRAEADSAPWPAV